MLQRLMTLLVAGGLAAPVAASIAPPTCDSTLPQVLNIGLPYQKNLRPSEIEGRLKHVLELREASGSLRLAGCPGRALQINAAFGTDYQILDWLGRGSVDMAVVPALSRHLLLRDGVDLVEILPPDNSGWLASRKRKLTAYKPGNGVRTGLDLALDLEQFRKQLLDRAKARSLPAGSKRQKASSKPPAKLPMRIVLLNHLSTVGFLLPVAETQYWLERRLESEPAAPGEGDTRSTVRNLFWSEFFDHACFRFTNDDSAQAAKCLEEPHHSGQPAATTNFAMIEETEGVGPAPPGQTFDGSQPVRDYLLMRAEAAERIFQQRDPAIVKVDPILPPDLEVLFGPSPLAPELEAKAAAAGQIEPTPGASWVAPPVFRSHASAESYFGTRSFAFTLGESVQLLRLHQEISGRRQLALVLPGGGVKAAYQSRLIDELYGNGYLKNRLVTSTETTGPQPLDVERVIGTSGGALLGFFVARLGENGPFNLSSILWAKGSPTGATTAEAPAGESATPAPKFLNASDVFPFTDLPRYASLVTILLVFGFVLAVASVGHTRWLSPRWPSDRDSGRAPLLLALGASLAGTPLLVSWLSGNYLDEHVPEFEGLLFAVLIGVAMFADQCLVAESGGDDRPVRRRRASMLVLVVGLLLIVLPVLGANAEWFRGGRPAKAAPSFPGPFLEEPISAGLAYLTLLSLATGLALVALRRRPGGHRRTWEIGLGLLAVAAGSVLAYRLLRLVSLEELAFLDEVPVFFLGLGATLVAALVSRIARKHSFYIKIAERAQRFSDANWLRWTAVILISTLGPLVILDFTRPAAKDFVDNHFSDLVTMPSKLGAPLGAFAASLGALLALIGFVLVLPDRRARFRLEGVREFVDAVLLLVVTLALTVYFVLWSISVISPGEMTLFELTPEFWLGLVVVSLLLSAALLAWAFLRRNTSRMAIGVGNALRYLTSRHPHGHLVSRRFARLGLIAVVGLTWWNFAIAPGMYSNRKALSYFKAVNKRFGEEYLDVHRAHTAYRLTAYFLAPANALKEIGTRFVLAVPDGEPCLAISQPPGSGTVWYRFRVLDQDIRQGKQQVHDECVDLNLNFEKQRQRLLGFVFASGSPFPIFPAHGTEQEALVDGGYTNNTPVEAAVTTRADQVLIVNSSPSRCETAPPGWFAAVLKGLQGPLVENTLRLPGFFFERSQQLDRRSRGNLFVISLSPSCTPDGWPLLSDFRDSVVKTMQEAAQKDLQNRIGTVEGWGPPWFQVSQQVRAAAQTDQRGSDAPATPVSGKR